jgi:ABC-type antimicrobial peptide transport system permease subunit
MVALLLASVGLYGVVSYLVLLRSKEMVIRLALGATRVQVARRLLAGMSRLVVVGIVLGVAGSLAVSRLIGSVLFGVSSTDPRTYALVCLVIAAAALLACGPPILRASRVNTMTILKEE